MMIMMIRIFKQYRLYRLMVMWTKLFLCFFLLQFHQSSYIMMIEKLMLFPLSISYFSFFLFVSDFNSKRVNRKTISEHTKWIDCLFLSLKLIWPEIQYSFVFRFGFAIVCLFVCFSQHFTSFPKTCWTCLFFFFCSFVKSVKCVMRKNFYFFFGLGMFFFILENDFQFCLKYLFLFAYRSTDYISTLYGQQQQPKSIDWKLKTNKYRPNRQWEKEKKK